MNYAIALQRMRMPSLIFRMPVEQAERVCMGLGTVGVGVYKGMGFYGALRASQSGCR